MNIKPRAPRRNSVEYLVCYGLHYCCLWSFLLRFKDKSTALIATRLGVTKRAVQYARKDFVDGCIKCSRAKDCVLKH